VNTYTYALYERPPGPGCQPMEGLISVSMEHALRGDKFSWGTATYNRQLTTEEKEHYCMEWIRTLIGGKTE